MKCYNQNKGFSLVELILTIMIMGIIAVALAPQVMKWVSESKEGTDFQSADGLKSTAQVSVAEFESNGGTLADEDYNIISSGVVVADGGADANAGMTTLIESYLHGEYPKVQAEDGKVFQIQMRASGKKVIVTKVTGTY